MLPLELTYAPLNDGRDISCNVLPWRPANGYNGLSTASLSDSADFPAGLYLLRHLLDGASGAMTFLKINQQNFSAIRLNEVTPDNLIDSVVGAFGEYIRA
jgi:hypothetical protein